MTKDELLKCHAHEFMISTDLALCYYVVALSDYSFGQISVANLNALCVQTGKSYDRIFAHSAASKLIET